MAKRGERFSACDSSEHVDHCLVDLLEAHSLSLLFLNAKTTRVVQSPTPLARNSPRWDDTIGQLSFLVPDADRCIATASELGGVVISEVLGDTDKAFLIKSPFEYTFTVIETTNLATKNIASVYLKTISSETIALCAVGGTAHDLHSDEPTVPLSSPKVSSKKTTGTTKPKAKRAKKHATNQLAMSSGGKAPRKLWDPITGRLNPFLHPYILMRDQYRLITPNATDPIPFSNDIFEGKMLLMVRSSLPMDEKFSQRFDIDKNMFELQVQGRFKRIPSGYMYLGGEITKKMELGLLTKGFASSLLQFCKSFNASIHHSYGDSQQVELPHIVGPFWSTIDRVVVTPPGELPPPFIKGFPEPPESRAARRAGNPLLSVKPPLDLDSTYSFSFKTRYVDLESWAVISVPLMKEFKLQTFWSDADLRFVAYFIDPDKVELDAKGFPKIHAQASLDRLFTLELQNAANHPEWKDNPSAAYYVPQAPVDDGDDDHHGPRGAAGDDHCGTVSCEAEEDEGEGDDEDEEEGGDGDIRLTNRLTTVEVDDAGDHDDFDSEDDFFDAYDDPTAASLHRQDSDATVSSSHGNSLSLSVGSSGASIAVDSASLTAALLDIQERQRQRQGQGQQSLASATPLVASSAQPQLTPQTPPPPSSSSTAAATGVVFSPELSVHTLPSRSDDQRRSSLGFADALSHLVTAVIEVDELRKTSSNNRRVLYAFAVFPREYLAGNVLAVSTQSVLRTYREWKDCLPVIKANKKQAAYDRWSETEQRRWQLDDSYRYLLQDAEKNHATRTRLESFLVAAPHTDHFLEATILSSTQTTQAAHSPSFYRLVQQLHELRDLTAAASAAVVGADGEKVASTVPLPAASFTAMLLSQLESNVCVRTGNFHWSQEHFSVTDTDVVLRRPGKRLGTIAKQTIPLTSVLDVRPLVAPSPSSTTAAMAAAAAAAAASSSFHEADAMTTTHPTLPIQLADLAGFVVTTFPRQYVVLVRGGDVARDVWVQALQVAVGRAMATAAAATDGGGVRPTSLSLSSSASSRRLSTKPAVAAAAADAAAGRETDSFSEKWSYAAAAVPSAAASIASNDALRAAFVAATSNGFEPQELLATPPSWQLNDRVILNARSFRLFELHRWHFCDPLLPFVSSAAPMSMSYAELWRRQDSPVELVEWLLDLVLHIAHVSTATAGTVTNSPSGSTNSSSSSSTTASTSNAASNAAASSLALSRAWMLFLDGVTLLQTLSLASMDLASPEAVAMFVNVFHLMLLHALLVLGPPTSLFKWQALFRNIAYEAFGDIFTLAELEHNIIKHRTHPARTARVAHIACIAVYSPSSTCVSPLPCTVIDMSRPSVNFIAKSFIPTSVYSFALQVRDYRILFALNSASTSNLPYVPVYTPRHLATVGRGGAAESRAAVDRPRRGGRRDAERRNGDHHDAADVSVVREGFPAFASDVSRCRLGRGIGGAVVVVGVIVVGCRAGRDWPPRRRR